MVKFTAKGSRLFRARGMTEAYRKGYEAGYNAGWKDSDEYQSRKKKKPNIFRTNRGIYDSRPWIRETYVSKWNKRKFIR